MIWTTDAPVIAERTLTCVQDGRRVAARIHAPEQVEGENAPWCCCFTVVGLTDFTGLAEDEVYAAEGRDAFEALAGAMEGVRNVLDRAHDTLRLEFSWAHADEEGWHAVPHWVPTLWGRSAERRLHAAVQHEETAMTRDGVGLEAFRRALARAHQERLARGWRWGVEFDREEGSPGEERNADSSDVD